MAEPLAAIDVADVSKVFRVPRQHVMTLKERALHPFRRVPVSELQALRDVSFQIRQGEFFGIVGRNGSGKSTLLKCLASIYTPDRGRISAAGRLVPFIELGVGFNMEMTALDNVVINGVMMGLSPREARRRFDEVIEFAELQDYVDLKLKNYSSGMQVRLAFSLMIQADADVLLIDEVLAVGDAAFQQKCMDVFYDHRERGKTVVLVTHDMPMVERFCHRTLLLEDGAIDVVGDPAAVARRYLELNFARPAPGADAGSAPLVSAGATMADVWVEDERGRRVDAVEQEAPLSLCALIEVHKRIERPELGMSVHDDDGVVAFATNSRAEGHDYGALEPGERVRVRVALRNRFRPGRWYVDCGLHAGRTRVVAFRWRGSDFISYGERVQVGLVSIDHDFELEREPEAIPKAEAPR
jgi:ABC-2 type transport system ATP-binding protein